ncbi:MAG: hypothetical protein D4R84_13525 [Rhodocyclaceae bacterium]|nr:MAG: hypothetical protein D4R84_13525 [Rhodocyclaceae bacterium]
MINDDSPPPYNIFALSDDANSILYACDGRSAFIGALEFDESSLAAFFAIAEVVSAIASVKTLYMLGYGFHEIVTENIASANLMSGDVQDEFEAMKTAIGNYANVPFNDGIDKLKQMFTSKW